MLYLLNPILYIYSPAWEEIKSLLPLCIKLASTGCGQAKSSSSVGIKAMLFSTIQYNAIMNGINDENYIKITIFTQMFKEIQSRNTRYLKLPDNL